MILIPLLIGRRHDARSRMGNPRVVLSADLFEEKEVEVKEG